VRPGGLIPRLEAFTFVHVNRVPPLILPLFDFMLTPVWAIHLTAPSFRFVRFIYQSLFPGGCSSFMFCQSLIRETQRWVSWRVREALPKNNAAFNDNVSAPVPFQEVPRPDRSPTPVVRYRGGPRKYVAHPPPQDRIFPTHRLPRTGYLQHFFLRSGYRCQVYQSKIHALCVTVTPRPRLFVSLPLSYRHCDSFPMALSPILEIEAGEIRHAKVGVSLRP